MAHGAQIEFYRGLEAGLPALADGEPGWTTDSHKLFVGQGGVNYQISGAAGVTSITAGAGLTGGVITTAGTIAVDWGTGTNQVRHGDDATYTNSRTPTAHAPTHKSGGTDPIKLDELAAPTDITTLNVSSTAHGLTPKSPADATKFLNGDVTPAYAQVKDSDLSLSDITTNNVSTTRHGLTPKLPNDATKYLDGTGVFSIPPGGTGTVTSFSAGNLSPLFTTSVATATTTPALSFALSTQAAATALMAPPSSSGTPVFRRPVVSDLGDGSTGNGAVVLQNLATVYDLMVRQANNNENTLSQVRATDTAPTGTFHVCFSFDLLTIFWRVDVTGTLTHGSVPVGRVSGLAAIATSGSASDLAAGTIPVARMPALTGDVTSPAGSTTTTFSSGAYQWMKAMMNL